MYFVVEVTRELLNRLALPPVASISLLILAGVMSYTGIMWVWQRDTIHELIALMRS